MLNLIKNTYKRLRGSHRRLFISCFWLIIFAVGFVVALESKNLFSQTVPSCSSLAPGTAITPDQNPVGFNCYYLGKPPCKTFVGTPQHRVNCADIIDLPLCSTIVPASDAASGVNCVKESSEISDPDSSANPRNVRGINYAVNNKDSIRFCNRVETCAPGEICDTPANLANNCARIKCHQLTASETPDKTTNCDILDCKLLTLEELKVTDNRFSDETKQYCAANSKCYEFFNNANINEPNTTTNNSDNLAYIIYRSNNALCKIHNCKPDSASCGADDTLVFNPSSPLYKGATYKEDYEQYINAGMPVEGGLCKPLNCQPVAIRQYVCDPLDCTLLANKEALECTCKDPDNKNKPECINGGDAPSKPNTNCDPGAQCTNGYCNKTIDCNSTSSPDNRHEPECIVSTPGSEDTDSDLFDAWFYRPTPPSRVVDNDGIVKTNIKNKIISDFCYSFNDLKDLNMLHKIDTILFGTYYSHYLTDPIRSPEMCSTPHFGTRGNGYGYLCGTSLNIFSNPSSSVGYIKGVAGVNYELTQPEYKIKGCLRYSNSGNVSVCGKRDCRIDLSKGPASDPVKSQWCGSDVCKEMRISQDDVDKCSMKQNGDIFSSNSSPDCVSGTIDDYVRMRARKYGRMICVYIDQKGAVAYNGKNFNGSETVTDTSFCDKNEAKVNGVCPNGYKTICVDGEKDAQGKCHGKNTNDDKPAADKWRTVARIQYVGNNRGNSKPGYIDMNGQYFPEQDCAKIPLRLGPPRLYNVATNGNSKTLFEPPLFILNARTIRGGSISSPAFGQQFGKTDFYQPEIVVQYGSEQQRMSLGTSFIGGDSSSEDFAASPDKVEIVTSINSIEHTASAFVKKEYSDGNAQPMLCLYRNVVDQFSMPLDPIKLSCVQRTKPDIRVDANMKVSITPDANNVFNSAKLKFRLISDGYNDCTGSNICSKEIIFENTIVDNESCSKDIESYQFCSKRDECSKLLYECANNEIALNNALSSGGLTAAFEAIKEQCNTIVLSNCNKKFGITDSDAPDFLSQIDSSITPNPNYQNFTTIFNSATKAKIDPKAYGWFNEICIVKGFEDKLKTIIAYKSASGLGKCQIDVAKSTYSSSVCNAGGGKAPYCTCSEFIPGMELPADQVARLETPREAGLCIDIPLPKFCPALDYTPTNSGDDFVTSSIANSHTNAAYNDATGIHTSHQTRTNNTIYHHAEYSSILGGSNNVAGSCNGFWKTQTNSQGNLLLPKLNCKIDGTWESVAGNNCERYSCPEIYTDYSTTTNSYTNNYADSDPQGSEGLSHGYALWHKKTKSSDFLDAQESAYQCITGFKMNASGIMPKRYCNQKGDWEMVSNPCQRITCPAQFAGDGTLVSNPVTEAEKNAWIANGGATFPTTNASRSSVEITPGSTASGTCNNLLGFFKLVNANNPTRTCDSNGNWSATVSNPCVTLDCNAIEMEAARQDMHGFALWPKITNVPAVIGGFRDVKASSCAIKGATPNPIIDWAPNPYGPIDPETGQPSLPTRHCTSVQIDNGWGTVWDLPIANKCVDRCPGADVDPIHGVTSEKSSTGLKNISWDSAKFGEYSYKDSSCNSMDASLFTQNRTNGCYRLRRLCGDGVKTDIDGRVLKKGEWGKAEPMCVANGGRNGNATYFADSNPLTTGSADSIAVNGTNSTGVCVSPTYWKVNLDTGASPVRRCLYKDATQNIDQVYLGLVSGTQDCVAKTCSITNNQTFGSPAYTRYSGANKTNIAIDSVVTLTSVNGKCKNNSDPTTVTCRLDANGNPTLQNLTNPYTRNCNTCNNNSPISYNGYPNHCPDCSVGYMIDRIKACSTGCGGGNGTTWPIPHNTTYYFSGSYHCGDGWTLKFQCVDGTNQVRSLTCH